MRCVNADTGQPATWGTMFLREIIGKALIGGISFGVTSLVSIFMILFGSEKRGVWDHVGGMLGTLLTESGEKDARVVDKPGFVAVEETAMRVFGEEVRGFVSRLKVASLVSLLIAALAVAPASAGFNGPVPAATFGAATNAPALFLAQAPTIGSISGTVTDNLGAPLAGVAVTGTSMSSPLPPTTAMTASDGTYQILNLAPGSYSVFFDAPAGLASEFWNNAQPPGPLTFISVAAGADSSGIDAQLELGGTVSGTVTDTLGAPLAGVTVSATSPSGVAWGGSAVSAADGSYQVDGLLPGDFNIFFEAPAGSGLLSEYWNNSYSLASASPVSVVAGVDTPGINAQFEIGGMISGTVTDNLGAPLAGVTVSAASIVTIGEGGSAVSASDGSYQVVGLLPGPFIVIFAAPAGSGLLSEYWNNVHDWASATPMFVSVGVDVLGIDAQLEVTAPTCNGLVVTVDLGAGEVPTSGADVILGTAGPDVINALGGDDTVCAGAGNDIVVGGAGNDTIFGEAGNDDLRGQSGDDTIDGGLGDDLIRGHAGLDTLIGGAGVDTLYGGLDADTIHGGDGNDIVQGAAGDDVIFGDSGDDFLVGGNGNDVVDGGLGLDVIYLTAGDDVGIGGAGVDEIRGGSGLDTISGGVGNDVLYGSTMADTINGGDGDDTIFGEAGNDVLNGDLGVDLIRGGDGADVIDGGAGNDTLNGDNGNDTVSGGAGDDIVRGQNNNDILYGGDGVDTLIGGNGLDSLSGGLGSPDTCNGGLLTDTADVTCEMLVNIP